MWAILKLIINARQTLTVFLEDRVGTGFLRQNRIIALDVLRTLSQNSDVSLQETCVLAWGQIAGYVLYLSFLKLPLILFMQWFQGRGNQSCALAIGGTFGTSECIDQWLGV